MPSVLIIDDDENLCQQVTSLLTQAGFAVIAAGSAREAYDRLSRALPDVAILDLGLPDASGLDVLSRLRREHAILPVLVLTADTSSAAVMSARNLGVTDYVLKPLDRSKGQTLIQKVHRAWNLVQMERAMRALKEESSVSLEEHAGFTLLRIEGPITERTVQRVRDRVPRGLSHWYVLDIISQPELDAVQLGLLERIMAVLPAGQGRMPAVLAGRNYGGLVGLGLDPESQLFLTTQDVRAYAEYQPTTSPLLGRAEDLGV